MKNLTKAVLVIILIAIVSSVIYLQIETENLTPKASVTVHSTPSPTLSPTPTSSPVPTPSPLPASVTADVNYTESGSALVINGTVTNKSPNTAYNVGLYVLAAGQFALLPSQTVIDMTVPIASGTYSNGETQTLSTLAPYQSVHIDITVIPNLSSQEPGLYGINATVVWSNMP